MMLRIAGVWELGWNTPLLEHDLWVYPLQEFAVDRWFMAPVSGISKSSLLTEVADLRDLIDDLRDDGVTVVFVDEKGDTPLRDFQHPGDVLYVTGRTSESVLWMRKNDPSVRVETVANGGGLWAHQAIVAVLYDRMVKQWR